MEENLFYTQLAQLRPDNTNWNLLYTGNKYALLKYIWIVNVDTSDHSCSIAIDQNDDTPGNVTSDDVIVDDMLVEAKFPDHMLLDIPLLGDSASIFVKSDSTNNINFILYGSIKRDNN